MAQEVSLSTSVSQKRNSQNNSMSTNSNDNVWTLFSDSASDCSSDDAMVIVRKPPTKRSTRSTRGVISSGSSGDESSVVQSPTKEPTQSNSGVASTKSTGSAVENSTRKTTQSQSGVSSTKSKSKIARVSGISELRNPTREPTLSKKGGVASTELVDSVAENPTRKTTRSKSGVSSTKSAVIASMPKVARRSRASKIPEFYSSPVPAPTSRSYHDLSRLPSYEVHSASKTFDMQGEDGKNCKVKFAKDCSFVLSLPVEFFEDPALHECLRSHNKQRSSSELAAVRSDPKVILSPEFLGNLGASREELRKTCGRNGHGDKSMVQWRGLQIFGKNSVFFCLEF